MSAEKIIKQIKKDSQNEVNQIKKEAEKRAKEIIKKSREEAEKEAEKKLEDGEKQSDNLKKILISQSAQDEKRKIMNTREQIIDECFLKAHHQISILKENEYKELIKKLINDGCRKLGKNCIVVPSRELDKKIAEEMGLQIFGNVEAAGGVILKSSDGKVTLNNTFDGILKREKNSIRIKVGKLLFS